MAGNGVLGRPRPHQKSLAAAQLFPSDLLYRARAAAGLPPAAGNIQPKRGMAVQQGDGKPGRPARHDHGGAPRRVPLRARRLRGPRMEGPGGPTDSLYPRRRIHRRYLRYAGPAFHFDDAGKSDAERRVDLGPPARRHERRFPPHARPFRTPEAKTEAEIAQRRKDRRADDRRGRRKTAQGTGTAPAGMEEFQP